MKNKTLAAWCAFMGGPFGLHRFYLFGASDRLGWILPLPTLIGLYGIYRARALGLDDRLSWLLIPMLGLVIAACAVNALVFGLMATDRWNLRFNPSAPEDCASGRTTWFTVAALVGSLLIGTTVLLASLAFSFQHYFEYQVEAARLISQPSETKKSAD
jgi:hypothetical protein